MFFQSKSRLTSTLTTVFKLVIVCTCFTRYTIIISKIIASLSWIRRKTTKVSYLLIIKPFTYGKILNENPFKQSSPDEMQHVNIYSIYRLSLIYYIPLNETVLLLKWVKFMEHLSILVKQKKHCSYFSENWMLKTLFSEMLWYNIH